jgi:hypothetical protein
MEKLTRQQQRAKERRANKPEPAPINRTSSRWMIGTKGQPFSRMKLVKITSSTRGVPAVFHVKGHTTNKSQSIKATWQNIDWFVRGISDSMKYSMLGRF